MHREVSSLVFRLIHPNVVSRQFTLHSVSVGATLDT